ncbi:MAG: diaminopimelate decarboxylase [Muribaculaceae bacterium]|nr:diaminopimelate decarboxylase [Muribaculaceae bacterium]
MDIKTFEGIRTPFYYYDRNLLERTLDAIEACTAGTPMKVHYAIKANSEPEILRIISSRGFGADCVSGNEITTAIECGFRPENIYYAGVGKTDEEILTGIDAGIGCFNIESLEEIDILSDLASKRGRKVTVALRVNPNIDAHTHEYITTGLKENKFGIDMRILEKAIRKVKESENLDLGGLHFHIGSQITVSEPFKILCERINDLKAKFRLDGIEFRFFNVGGGLGIDYDNPDENPIPDFATYFSTILANLHLDPGQEVHCELGRAIVAQCGSLISKVVLVKNGLEKSFVIIDAGMSDLIRPALYGAHHKIENISAEDKPADKIYDVVGPICESSDVFGKDELLPETHRGDLLALRSAGAYGSAMASRYNMRDLPGHIVK